MTLQINAPEAIEQQANASVDRLKELFAMHDLLKKLTVNAQAVLIVRFPEGEDGEGEGKAVVSFGAGEAAEFEALLRWGAES